MNTPHHEPLTPEERALAARLSRLGPHDGPSPALDAKILAAAHASVAGSVAGPRRQRWPTLAGIAATLALAIGLAWQLRPQPEHLPERDEAPTAAAASVAADATTGTPADSASAGVAETADLAAAAAPAEATPTTVAEPAPAPPMAARQMPRAPAKVLSPPATSSAAGRDAAATAARERAAVNSAARQRAGTDTAVDREEAAVAASARQRPRAFAIEPAAPVPEEPATTEMVAAPPPAPPSPPPAAPAMKTGPAPVGASFKRSSTAPTTVTSGTRADTPAQPTEAAAEDRAVLDAITVTGSRITIADLPVADDARLDPVAWLERIRQRRDADDLVHARESLALFRRTHPRLRIPADLRALAQ